MIQSKSVAFIGVFAALHVVLYVISFDLWRNWSIYLEPLEGIILGPYAGFFAAFIGSIVARMIKPIDFWMFGIIAEPFSVLVCGFLAKKLWKPPIIIYVIMLTAYFLHPFGRWLPLWTVLDVIVAFILIYPVAMIFKSQFEEDNKRLPLIISLISFIGAATDALTRVFLFVPLGLYNLFFLTPEGVYLEFIRGAANSYIEDVSIVAVSFLVGVPLLIALRKIPGVKFPLS
jgi:predicted membrane protein